MNKPAMIETIHLANMTDPHADQTYTGLVPIFNTIAITVLQAAAQEFEATAKRYSDALKQQRISVVTEDIQALDRNRDRALTGLFHEIANALLSTP